MLGPAFGALRTLTSVVPLVRWPAFGDLGEAKAQGVRVSNGERGAVMLMELIGKRKVKMVKSSLKSSLKSMFHLAHSLPEGHSGCESDSMASKEAHVDWLWLQGKLWTSI